MSQAGASAFPCLKVPIRDTFSGRTWPQLIISAPQPYCSLKRRCPWWPISPESSSAETDWGLPWIFSINECTAETGHRPLTRRYGLTYDTASMRATPQSREKFWRGWPSACAARLYAEELIHWWESNDKCLIHICAKWRFCEPKSNDLAKDLLLSNSTYSDHQLGAKGRYLWDAVRVWVVRGELRGGAGS